MAIFITRSTVIPFWLLVCTIVAVWSPPLGTTDLLIVLSGLATLVILLLSRSAVQAPVTYRRLPTIALKPPGPPAWPNSGFRNIGRGTKGG